MNNRISTRPIAGTAAARRLAALRLGRSRCDRSGGFTMIELLVAISIIGIISAFLAGAVFAAQESARRTATEAMISKLHSQMAMRWEDYATRRVAVNSTFQREIILSWPPADRRRVELLAGPRLLAQQELMRFELPDQYIDIIDPRDIQKDTFPPHEPEALALASLPSLHHAYRRRIGRVFDLSPGSSAAEWKQAFEMVAAANQSSECLYMIMTTGMIDETSGGEYFSDGDSGDTDGDGMPEFIDGWGQPIEWIRWPTAFVSDLQPAGSAGNFNGDPFNPTLVDEQEVIQNLVPYAAKRAGTAGVNWGYRLSPLIVSLGRDGFEGIHFIWYDTTDQDPAKNLDIILDASDPYASTEDEDDGKIQRGDVRLDPDKQGRSYEDNVHNHLIGTR